jgi:hypothetical protein
MIDTKDLIDLKTRIIKYIKHIIKTSSTINENDIKKYFIFWLYLTDLTDENVTVDNNNFNTMESSYANNLINEYKDKNISISNKSDYFRNKFYFDCDLYNIELGLNKYLNISITWYNEFVTNKVTLINNLKFDITQPSDASSLSNTQNSGQTIVAQQTQSSYVSDQISNHNIFPLDTRTQFNTNQQPTGDVNSQNYNYGTNIFSTNKEKLD